MPAGRTPRVCIALALLAAVVRLGLASRALVVLDRLFVPDDTYYTLAIARSIARGMGPTVDGVHLTSGFQPLLAFLLVPFFRISENADAAFRTALVIGACADAVTTWLLGHLAYRISWNSSDGKHSRLAAVLASVSWALSSSAIRVALNGLESSLSVAIVLGAVSAWIWARHKDTTVAWVLSGTLLGLSLLARVDTIFVVAVVGLATLYRAGIRRTIESVAGALAVVAPWWLYSLVHFKTVIPESGSAVREQTLTYAAMGMNVRDTIAWAAGAAVGPPLVDSTWLRAALGSGASAIGMLVGIALVATLLRVASRARYDDALRILALAGAVVFSFYALYLPATWFFRRYLLPLHVLTALGFALVGSVVWQERESSPRRAWSLTFLAHVALVAALGNILQFATFEPAMTIDQGHHGAKGYREPAREILALAPPGAVIGSFQSGALGWFADGSGKKVVNLDGVVDGQAAKAFRQHDLAAFARSRGVTHLADWDFNVRHFLARSGDPRIARASLRPLGTAEAQGAHEHFVLYAITWPD